MSLVIVRSRLELGTTHLEFYLAVLFSSTVEFQGPQKCQKKKFTHLQMIRDKRC